MRFEYTNRAACIVVFLLILTPGRAGGMMGGEHPHLVPRHTDALEPVSAEDWVSDLVRLLDLACQILACDSSSSAIHSSIESRMEWWNQLYRTRGVRKGMKDGERQNALRLLDDIERATAAEPGVLDPTVTDQFARTLLELRKMLTPQ